MRLLHTFNDPHHAQVLSLYLKNIGVENLFEAASNTDWGSSDYGLKKCSIWVIEEDQYETAKKWLQEFEINPNNPLFKLPENPLKLNLKTRFPNSLKSVSAFESEPLKKKLNQFPVTFNFLLICIALFLIGVFTTPHFAPPPVKLPYAALYSPPINKWFLYDYPKPLEMTDKFVKINGLDSLYDYQNLPPEQVFILTKIIQTPVWDGFYSIALRYFQSSSSSFQLKAPLFEKINQGEIWRLFTPCLLHNDSLHLFFNMLLLVYIGKLVEDRLGSFRFLFLIMMTGIFSNTAEYLMSGFNFLGFSGALCGLIGFAWARHKQAPWENYQLAPGTFSLLFISIFSMAAIQVLASILRFYYQFDTFPTIANTAHISGLIAGYLLGRINYMSIKY